MTYPRGRRTGGSGAGTQCECVERGNEVCLVRLGAMASTIQNLLDEISWEGKGSSYRGGGAGKENVLTAEVWQALVTLPRGAFLGAVLKRSHRVSAQDTDEAPVPLSARMVRSLQCEVLCGDRSSVTGEVRVQPDVLLESDEAVVLVEAKRVRGGAFQAEQVARSLLVLDGMCLGRKGLLLLVLGSPPPIRVKGYGARGIEEALGVALNSMRDRGVNAAVSFEADIPITWITWAEIADVVSKVVATFSNADADVVDAVHRSVRQLVSAMEFHS